MTKYLDNRVLEALDDLASKAATTSTTHNAYDEKAFKYVNTIKGNQKYRYIEYYFDKKWEHNPRSRKQEPTQTLWRRD